MKRLTFIKTLVALAVAPFIPKIEAKENPYLESKYKLKLRTLGKAKPMLHEYYKKECEKAQKDINTVHRVLNDYAKGKLKE